MKLLNKRLGTKNIISSLLVLIAVLLFSAFAPPFILGNGLNNYPEDQRRNIDYYLSIYNDDVLITEPISYYRAERSIQIDPVTVGCNSNEREYLVVIGRRTWFGMQNKVILVTPCGQTVEGDSVNDALEKISQL